MDYSTIIGSIGYSLLFIGIIVMCVRIERHNERRVYDMYENEYDENDAHYPHEIVVLNDGSIDS